MNVQILHEWSQVDRLAPEWNELLRRSRADTIFLTWEWVAAWRSASPDVAKPCVVVVRDGGGRLVGLGPFYRTLLRFLRAVPFRTLRVLGDYQTGSEYGNVIVDRAHEAEAIQCIMHALQRSPVAWDCVWVPRMSGWTGALDSLHDACSASNMLCRQRPRPFSAISLPVDPNEFFASLSKNARSMLRRRTRELLSVDHVSFEWCESPEDVTAYLDALFELNDRRWSERGMRGSFFRKPFERQFYRRFAPVSLERGWLRLSSVRIDGEFRAIQVGHVYNGIFHQMQEGFDPSAPTGIGNVLRERVIQRCIREGIRTYDFLGGSTEHKRRWLAQVREGGDLFFARRSIRTRLLFAGAVWPTGRYLRERSPFRV